MTEYETRTTRITVLPKGDTLFSEMATHVEIDDEAAGEFVVVKQSRSDGDGTIQIDRAEWSALRAAIDTMIGECRGGHADA